MSFCKQCCAAAGNLAGDCQEFRDTLVAMGALQPLARLAASPMAPGADASDAACRAAATGAWALSNVLRGAGREVGVCCAALPGLA